MSQTNKKTLLVFIDRQGNLILEKKQDKWSLPYVYITDERPQEETLKKNIETFSSKDKLKIIGFLNLKNFYEFPVEFQRVAGIEGEEDRFYLIYIKDTLAESKMPEDKKTTYCRIPIDDIKKENTNIKNFDKIKDGFIQETKKRLHEFIKDLEKDDTKNPEQDEEDIGGEKKHNIYSDMNIDRLF